MRVAVVEDSALFRAGLTMLLASVEVEVTRGFASGEELLSGLDPDPPDVVVLDIRMPPTFTDEGLSAGEALRKMYPDVGILFLSAFDESSYAERVAENFSGRVGYLLKDRVADAVALREAIRRVADGELVIDEKIVANLIRRRSNTRGFQALSDRERTVLEYVAQGLSNTGIARNLEVSHKTVEAHVINIFTKLELPASVDTNRRVLAAVRWLREVSG